MTLLLILALAALGLAAIKLGPYSAGAVSTAAGMAALALTHGNTRLTAAQIAQYASAAGFADSDLVIAVAVALAESGGDPEAHGDLNLGSGTGSFGLWQIYADAHPEFGPDFTALYDPAANAAAAFSIYSAAGNSFKPWSTFKGGQYTAFVQAASNGVNA